jgi:hypothetical protein
LTVRCIIFGLLVAILIPVVGYFSDQVLRRTIFVGNQFPIVVFGPLVLFLILSSSFKRRRGLRGGEIAVVLAMALAACNIPGGGLLRMLTRTIGMPIHFNKESAAWRDTGVLEAVPKVMLPNRGKYDEDFTGGFMGGLGETGEPIRFDRVPWEKWAGPLAFWWPLAFLLGFASVCLALVVHQQWSQRERLQYPVAQFANAILARQTGQAGGSIFRSRLFWLGAIALLVIHVINGLAVWWPNAVISIPTAFSFAPLLQKYDWLMADWSAHYLFSVKIWPMVVAFGFLIPADVSLSLGLSQVFWVLLIAWLVNGLGMTVHGTADLGAPPSWQRAGSSLAIAVMILYTGRRYYWEVLRGAVTFRRSEEAESHAVWACRWLILSLVAIVALLDWVGLPWPLGVLFVALVMITYLIQARINTESGLIFSLLGWLPSVVLLGLFGPKAFGLSALVICGVVGNVFVRDTHECLMPFVLNSLRVSQHHRISAKRAGSLALVGFAVALVVGVPWGLWVDHNYGVMRGEKFATLVAPRITLAAGTSMVGRLRRAEAVEESKNMSVWRRFANVHPDGRFLWSLGLGFAGVLLISGFRLRFPWWPIHPMMFLVWGTWAMAILSHSFFLGWAIKRMTTKFGLSESYAKVRLLMFGVIAGELLGGLLWMLVGYVYYAATGHDAPRYDVFPGGT